MIKLDQLKEAFNHAFKVVDGKEEMSAQDFDLLDKLAMQVVKRNLCVPAVMFLETLRPLNVVGSSMMSFFRPILGQVFNRDDYQRLEQILERRCSVGCLIEAIEKAENNYNEKKVNEGSK